MPVTSTLWQEIICISHWQYFHWQPFQLSQKNFHTFFFFFFFNQWNIWMKECLVGNEVFWSYYSKQNYFNLGANALLFQHDLISPTMWWSDHIDPISQHEPERSTLKKKKPPEGDSEPAIFSCIQIEIKHLVSITFNIWCSCHPCLYCTAWLGETFSLAWSEKAFPKTNLPLTSNSTVRLQFSTHGLACVLWNMTLVLISPPWSP